MVVVLAVAGCDDYDKGGRITLTVLNGDGLPRRWLLLGAGGAGKTTLGVELSGILRIPIIHLDCHYWRPEWVAPSDDNWDAKVLELAAGDAWIMDGNYSRTLPLRLPRAEAAVLLDIPAIQCLWGVIGRCSFRRRRARPDLPVGCNDRFFPDPQFLRYVATYKRRSRPRVLSLLRNSPHVRLFHLRSRRQARVFLDDLNDIVRSGARGGD